MKNIYNPTNDAIEVTIFGVSYSVGPKETILVSEAVAEHWVKNLHNFMEVSDVVSPKVDAVQTIEIPEEIIVTREEVIESLGTEVVEEAEKTEVEETVAKVVKKKYK